MRNWIVITPEYGDVVPVLDYGQGPIEYGCDAIEIEAASKRDAIALGVKAMLNSKDYRYCRESRQFGENPYARVKAELIEDDAAQHHEEVRG